ncbi:MAG: trypsin-like peptidase domain-containing protein [Gammaproteobacteria bacterium]|nr:trypsin-like peptidase domain-containing protein [Gammaproteobacteria bacterium]
MLKYYKLLVIVLCCVASVNARSDNPAWAKTIERVTDSIITIRVDATRAFDTSMNNTTQATGFVVDAERGIILTNRHVVQSGPVVAEALFSNREEVELKAIYRDPVHDFGFFQYKPVDLKFIKPVSLKLKPEKAKVGREIRVIGNDAGEQLSILAGTLARLDRPAPYYGHGRYNDFNTFYYQSASGVSGGSSGSPVIDINGDVLALNAGGSRQAASSFFLPLERVVRALKLIQKKQKVTRGTLQTTFSYTPYDEVRRLGLTAKTEAQLRKINNGVGVLVVESALPGGSAYQVLEVGDVLLKGGVDKKKLNWMRRFEELEKLFDDNVGKKIFLLVERNGKQEKLAITVDNLHAITPDNYLTFGEAVVHDLSYQQARHLNRPVEGVYVAQQGYVLSRSGMPRGSVIFSVNDQAVKNTDEFEKSLSMLADGEQVRLRYITFNEPRREHVTVIKMERRWFAMRRCYRNDIDANWQCRALAKGPVAKSTQPIDVSFPRYKDKRASRLAPSIVYVQYDMPFNIDGITDVHYGGGGLIVDAEKGLVITDRNTVPVAMGDVRLVFAGAIEIPAKVLFVHPVHNMAIVQYDPVLIGNTHTESAVFSDEDADPGDEVWMIGIKSNHRLHVEEMKVSAKEPLRFALPVVPRFRESNLDAISLGNAPFTRGGVLTNEDGEVVSLWSSFSYADGDEIKQYEWGIPAEIVTELMQGWECCQAFNVRSLEVEMAYLNIARARKLGLSDEWVKKIQKHDDKQQVLVVSRRVAGSPAYEKFQEGDLILMINNEMVSTFRDVEKKSKAESVSVTIVRSGNEITFDVPTVALSGRGTERVLQWAGALLQNPHRAIAAQRGIAPEGVYVSFVWWGAPASRYGLSAVTRIVEIDGVKVKNLDDFVAQVKDKAGKRFIRLKTLDLLNKEEVITLKQNQHYWPTRDIRWDGNIWQGVTL